MNREAINLYLKIDDEFHPVKDQEVLKKIKNPPIYEVVRVINGKPLFLKPHLKRLAQSSELVNWPLIRNLDRIEADFRELIDKLELKNGNVKLLQAVVDGSEHFIIYEIDHFYPPEEAYTEGVKVGIYEYSRDNPNAKVFRNEFRQEMKKIQQEKDAFEMLLMGSDGTLPEGSRSNAFYVKDDKLYTSPTDRVLQGITRQMVLKICEEIPVEVMEETLTLDEVKLVDGAFLSGTSIGVLPIAQIEDMEFQSAKNPLIKEIRRRYEKRKEDDIE